MSNASICQFCVDSSYEFDTNGSGVRFVNFIRKSDALDPSKGFLWDGNSLKIYCQIFLDTGLKLTKSDQSIRERNILRGSDLLAQQLKCLKDCQDFSDVVLTTNTKSFPTFKCILAGADN